MSKKGITGHDEWVVTQALATALVALEQLPEKIQPRPHMEDLRKLLTAGSAPPEALGCIWPRRSAGCFHKRIPTRSTASMAWRQVRD